MKIYGNPNRDSSKYPHSPFVAILFLRQRENVNGEVILFSRCFSSFFCNEHHYTTRRDTVDHTIYVNTEQYIYTDKIDNVHICI